MSSIFFISPAAAQLPAARITSIFPPGGRVGTTVEVTVAGTELDGATELRFSRPGVSAKPIAAGTGAERKFAVTIDADVPIGACEVRFLGAYGISNARAFALGTLPELAAGLKAISVGSVVNTRCNVNVVDSYTIALKAGERVLFSCATRLLDSKMSPVMVLIDGAHHEVERSRRGGLLDFTVPADGTYTLQVHDLLYRGGADFFYRLETSVKPHIDAIFPAVGQAGSKSTYAIYGRNIPGSKPSDFRAADGKLLDQLDVEIELPDRPNASTLDASAALGLGAWLIDPFAYRLKSDCGESNPISIGIGATPTTIEQELNDDAAHAQKLALPAEVGGRFYPHGDSDYFTFDVSKGDVYWIDLIAQRMGLPSKPVALLQRVTHSSKGTEEVADVQEIEGTDAAGPMPAYRTSTRDGSYRFEASEAGTYRLIVRDLYNTSIDNAALTYRLSIRKPRPDFHLLALPIESTPPAQPNEVAVWSPSLRKGGAYPIRLYVTRQDGFDGDVEVSVAGLPDGISSSGGLIPAGQSTGMLTLTAKPDAPAWCGPASIIGHARVTGDLIDRPARIANVVWPSNVGAQEAAVSRVAEDFVVGVSEEMEAVAFELPSMPLEVVIGGKLTIPVKIHRNLAATGPTKLTTGGLAAVSTVKELTLPPDKSDGAIELDLNQQKLGVGVYAFFLQAQGPVTFPRRTFPLPEKAKDVKTTPQNIVATSYSSLIVVKVVAKPPAKGK